MSEKRFWACHVRTPYFDKLRDHGFLVLYPMMDDYVFLESKPENLRFIRMQQELGISFIKVKGNLQVVTEAEIQKMKGTTVDLVTAGAQIEVVSGYAENLEGVVLEERGDKLLVLLDGYKRKYELEVDRLDVAKLKTKS